ncbi:hypothetical protein [Marinimicrobium locisalis]|uniref:hypothetical protein n=1 Tax=Marinimicrobium locisalis TaxID=546022 RepID=UPI003221A814
MNIWTLVVLLGVVAMVVGPLMLLQPSARERRQAELRERARQEGILVSLRALPRQATDMEAPSRIPAYKRPAGKGGGPTPPWMLVRAAYQHEAHFLGHWTWQGAGRASAREQQWLAHQLPSLPQSVQAVAGDAKGWSVYWTELGGIEALEGILDFLKGFSRTPKGEERNDRIRG